MIQWRSSALTKVIFDTNIYQYAALGYVPMLEFISEHIMDGSIILMPQVIHAELLSIPKYYTDNNVKKYIDGAIGLSLDNDGLVPMNEEIITIAANSRVRWMQDSKKKLPLPDSIIAATAVSHGAILYSNNDNDFSFFVKEHHLDYLNPVDREDLERFLIENGLKKKEPDYIKRFSNLIDRANSESLKPLVKTIFAHLGRENKVSMLAYAKNVTNQKAKDDIIYEKIDTAKIEGFKDAQKVIAEGLVKEGFPNEFIVHITKLSKNDINAIRGK
jgi:predicted nucleic acid-binding protein